MEDLQCYQSLKELFTRKLKHGVRPISHHHQLVCICVRDGAPSATIIGLYKGRGCVCARGGVDICGGVDIIMCVQGEGLIYVCKGRG